MKWPFQPKEAATDARVYRNPKTGLLTLRLQGDIGLPLRWEQPILNLNVRLEAAMTDDVAAQLRDQLNMLLPPPDSGQ